jgi:hypothetical protein
MYCYYQDQHAHPAGLRYFAPVAIGVCHHCGAAVCAEHGQKGSSPGAPLLCYECAKLQPINGHELVQNNSTRQLEFS